MVYDFSGLDSFLSTIDKTKTVRAGKKTFYNLPMSFDIETSSFYQDDCGVAYSNDEYKKMKFKPKAEKKAIMYVWQFAICDNVIMGRTWEEFLIFSRAMYDCLELQDNYIVVYVHNLSYEFQFLCKRFKWLDIFADSERKPIKATNEFHFVFKCSYRLSGYSLAVLAENLKTHSIKKLVGDLDYNLLRNSKTPLSEQEKGYCVNDVLIVTAYIAEQIEEFKGIENIPLTQTGKVRRFVRKRCFANPKYKFLMQKLTIDKTEYMLLKNAFAGGFTHCNAMYANTLCENVTSYDFTSSYPTVLISEKYPMGKGLCVKCESQGDLEKLIKNYAVLVDLRFTNIKASFLYDNILSASKCRGVKNATLNNGRIVSADSLAVTLTDIDFLNVKDFYEWERLEIGLCYIYKRGYLPPEIVETILTLYKDKTELKGVKEKEVEYLHSKELLNSIYGMCVTSIVHDKINFLGEWKTTAVNIESEIENYNKDKNRFLFYQWGVWCTAYARNNLYTAIKECKADYIYSDTDSVKIFNAEKHKEYFDRYNEWITKKLAAALDACGLDKNLTSPKTIKGVSKPLGVWDFDGHYERFKTLGAKRYINESGGKLSITVCGLSKKSGKDYIAGADRPFDFFNDGMFVDSDHTGKMIHTYIDNEIKGKVTDYLGNEADYCEKSFIHLEKTDYLLSLSKMYIDYFSGLQALYR